MFNEDIDNLIFSPHPDDESLACGGLIATASQRGEKTKIVFLTNGDANTNAAAKVFEKESDDLTSDDYINLGNVRKNEVLAATKKLGVEEKDVVFLGYPDRRLARIYKTKKTSLRPTKKTWGVFFGDPEPESALNHYGASEVFSKESIVGDISSLLTYFTPRKIYVPAEFDSHSDHKATFWFVRDAIKHSRYSNEIYIYVVHGGNDKCWPFPRGKTPNEKMEQIKSNGNILPAFVPWPPSMRLPVDNALNEIKLQALYCHDSQFCNNTDREYYESFIKSEEIFWQIDPIHYPNW